MSSPIKKQKKKTDQQPKTSDASTGTGSSPIDYSVLLPADMDKNTRKALEDFLRDGRVSAEQQPYIDTFLMGLTHAQAQATTLRQASVAQISLAQTSSAQAAAVAQAAAQAPASAQASAAAQAAAKAQAAVAQASVFAQVSAQAASTAQATPATVRAGPPSIQLQERKPEPGSFTIANPHPQCLSEERSRINVGWMTSRVDCDDSTDEKVAPFCQKLGVHLYNYISYPIGGMHRSHWIPVKDRNGRYTPPRIWLPDLQLKNHLWELYVNGHLSNWIDCDSEDPEIAALSQEEIIKELNYAVYLGIRSVIINLRRVESPNLAEIVNKWLWTRSCHTVLWIVIPTSINKFIDYDEDIHDYECWEVWANFRTKCSNFAAHKLNVGLEIGEEVDEEFTEERGNFRWLSEPLGVFLFETSAFITCPVTSKAVLPQPYIDMMRTLWTVDTFRILVRGTQHQQTPDHLKLEYSVALRNTVKDLRKPSPNALYLQNLDYYDVLQTPLQPLSENLDSGVYNTFEQDTIKYSTYCKAIEAAITDLADNGLRPETLVLYVLGAGRGPLMNAAIKAERDFNTKFRGKYDKLILQLFVVEKNPNALLTLHFINEKLWKNRVRVIEGDMRKLNENADFLSCPKPDIIVSELLGSFGDNELSPECLDGITFHLKPTTISIPYSYTSFVSPIQSSYLYNSIRSYATSFWNKGTRGVGREGLVHEQDGSYTHLYHTSREETNQAQLYVVYLRHYFRIANPKPVFTFNHPNTENNANEREARIVFDYIDERSELMGFAAYFTLHLYKDIVLSINPVDPTPNMYSWFPAIIPINSLERVFPEDKIIFDIKRKVDAGGVWYEWFVEIEEEGGNIRKTEIQNKNGVNNYLRFFDPDVRNRT